MERFSAHEKNAVKRPKSVTATWKSSGQTSSPSSSQGASAGDAMNVDQLRREGYLANIWHDAFNTSSVTVTQGWARSENIH